VKLEHLPASPDGHDELIRLFNFDAREAAALMAAVSDWLRDPSGPLQLDTLPFIFNVNCSVLFVVADKDEGIRAIGAGAFECRLRIASFKRMLNLMEPFSEETTGYQWLYDLDTPIELLFSSKGAW
jgi:hypothetical protein